MMALKPSPRRAAPLGLALFLAAAAALPSEEAAAPQPPLDPGRGVVVLAVGQGGDEARRFAEALAVSLAREAEATGLSASRGQTIDASTPEPEAAKGAALASGARWVFVARASVVSRRLLWRAAVYDGSDGALYGADAYSAYAGLSALPLLDASAKGAAQAAKTARDLPERPSPIAHRLSFSSADEGAEVFFGLPGTDAASAGIIAEGLLEAPYFPFMPGERLEIGVDKEGYWPRGLSLKVKPEPETLSLPPLFKETSLAWGANYGIGRLLGAAASLRWYPLPDRIYLRAENALWAAYDFRPGSRPVLHDELRLGAAAYLFFDPEARFRSSLGLGLSGIATLLTSPGLADPFAFDLCLEPIFFTLEWHFADWAIVLEQRFPYSLGLDSGLLPRQWLELGGSGPLFVSLGVIFKL